MTKAKVAAVQPSQLAADDALAELVAGHRREERGSSGES